MDSRIDKLHRHLADLEGESVRQQAGAKQITAAAEKRLEAVNTRLSEIHAMTDSAEYQALMEERGKLAQILEQGRDTPT